MDGGEADQLIIADLKTLGCTIPDEVKGVKDFNATLFVNCILKILRGWDKSREYPRQLSNTRAQRVNQTTQLVSILKELGLSEDLSYHNLLYPNALDTKKVFLWLLSRVPIKEIDNDDISLINKRIEAEIDFLIGNTAVWTPAFTSFNRQRGKNYYKLSAVSTRVLYSPYTPTLYPGGRRVLPEQKRYFSQFMPFFTAQTKNTKSIAPSVIEYNIALNIEVQDKENEWNTVGIGSGKNPVQWRKDKHTHILKTMAAHIRAAALKKGGMTFAKTIAKVDDSIDGRAQKFGKEVKQTENVETEEDIRKRRETEQREADAKLAAAEANLQRVEQEIQVAGTEALQLTALLQKEAEKTVLLKKQYLEIKATLDLVKNAAENMIKLQESIAAYRNKLLDWQGKWESKRTELVDGYRDLKLQYSKREEEMYSKREEIKAIRAEIKGLLTANKDKDERYKQLVQIYKATKDQEKRTTYTAKILVLVGTVKKYRVEINTILIDTKNVQKEINALTDTLTRTFADVEELIYKEAIKDTKDKPVADAYKSLAKLDEVFKELADLFQKTGSATNATLFINDKITKLEARTTSLNMEKIVEDLQQVLEENAKLKAKIASLTS